MDTSIVPQSPGIYIIRCLANNRIYVGSAVNLRERYTQHWRELRNDKHFNVQLQRAWDKYGESVFTFEILEFVMRWSLLDREQYWLGKLKPFGKRGFNIVRDVRAAMNGRRHTPETIAKMSMTKKGKTHTPEHRAKNSASHSYRWLITSPAGNVFEVTGLRQFCMEHGLSFQLLHNVATGKQRHHKGWRCRRVET